MLNNRKAASRGFFVTIIPDVSCSQTDRYFFKTWRKPLTVR